LPHSTPPLLSLPWRISPLRGRRRPPSSIRGAWATSPDELLLVRH